jgi:uncharacterized SAM-binding protein YcdF (DUF218 family)
MTQHIRLFTVLASTLFFSSCGIINHYAINTFEKNVRHAPYDVVIVPGIPYDTSKMNPIFKGRMLWAKSLYDNGIARNIIFSGSAVHTPYVEGYIMKMMADSMGIPADRTFIEDKALRSTENVEYGVKLAHKLGFKNIAIATDPLQILFLKKYTRDFHAHVALLPFRFDAMAEYYKSTLPKVEHANAFVENFIPRDKRVVASID